MYLQRRDYSWYFRLPIPKTLRTVYGKSEICFSLKTKSKREAQLKSLEHIYRYLIEFEKKSAEVGSLPITSTLQAEIPSVKSVTFLQVYEKFLKERKATIGTELEFDTVVKRFVAICEDKEISLVLRQRTGQRGFQGSFRVALSQPIRKGHGHASGSFQNSGIRMLVVV